jgi:hypothetical protein
VTTDDALLAKSLDEQRDLVTRILLSRHFERANRMREFLTYITDRYFEGRCDSINEQTLGHAVFGRRANYNPSEDNIVRVEARNLRKRLQAYFLDDGLHESTVLTIPKGGYVPHFGPRELAAISLQPVVVDHENTFPLVAGDPFVASQTEPDLKRSTFATPGSSAKVPKDWGKRTLVVFCAAACLLAGIFGWKLHAVQEQERTTAAQFLPFWSQLFDPKHETFLVAADSALVLMRKLHTKPIGLPEYLEFPKLTSALPGETLSPEALEMLRVIAARQYTSVADVDVAGRILQANAGHAGRAHVRYARRLSIEDFKSNHVILMGSSISNPWLELFDKHLNFRVELDTRPYFINKSPQKDELDRYYLGGLDGKTDEAYAVVAMLPNLGRSGNVLIIAGNNMEGTGAAGEFICRPDFARLAATALKVSATEKLPPFELLLKLVSVAGGSKDAEIEVARRITAAR